MSEPLVSVVLPTYNGSRFIEGAVASVLAQTHGNWELIVVDDASTDGTPEILDRLAAGESRIQLVRHPENRKLPAALNTGFSRATGDYLTWTSDDNLYDPEALEVMVRALESRAEIDVVYTSFRLIDEAGGDQGLKSSENWQDLVCRNVIGACFLYRKAVQEAAGGYSEPDFLAEDYEFWLRAAYRFAFAALDSAPYRYRLHPHSLTERRNEVLRATIRVVERHVHRIPWANRRLRSRANVHLAYRYWLLGRKARSAACLASALLLHPIALANEIRRSPAS